MKEPNPFIFVSYRVIDTLDVADRLATELRCRFGHDAVFFDRRTIGAGDSFDATITHALTTAAVVLVLVGRKWLTAQNEHGQQCLAIPDDWVRKETEIALTGDAHVIPVLVNGASAVSGQALSHLPSIRPLANLQACLLSTTSWESELQSLVETLARKGIQRGRPTSVGLQQATEPVDPIRQWQSSREAVTELMLSATRDAVVPDLAAPPLFPTHLVDRIVSEQIGELRQARFFTEYDTVRSSLRLAKRLLDGDLSGGSDRVRSQGLAWCARLLLPSPSLKQAEHCLAMSRVLGDSDDLRVAEAFMLSQKGDKPAALKVLAEIDSEVSRTVALMIVAKRDGIEAALEWIRNTGYPVTSLDPDGKRTLLSYQLQLSRWGDAAATVAACTDTDYQEAPSLHHLVALSKLAGAIPPEFRQHVIQQVPFNAADFRLASDAVSMDARRAAHQQFVAAAEAARTLGCSRASSAAEEYSLWLELRDPALSGQAKTKLRDRLRDPNTALAYVHHAIQFDLDLDLGMVEREIERNAAINGALTIEAALARYALAFTQPTPLEVGNYIARYFEQLAPHIDTKVMLYRQVEMFARAGYVGRANRLLDGLLNDGIPPHDEQTLRRLIAEAEGQDPVQSQQAQYEATDDLVDLINLVAELERQRNWTALCEFGQLLFTRTRELRDAERLATALSRTESSSKLLDFLKENPELLLQSRYLRMLYAWGLYEVGAFLESRDTLSQLRDDVEDPNYRSLQLKLGIATGDWASLSGYIAEEYQGRDSRTAQELIRAGQLALNLGSPHAMDLVFAAATKADDDPLILTAAYFLATNSGSEHDPLVFQWLTRAAELSGDNGPLQRLSVQEVLERKPEWDRRESETWRLIAEARVPLFVAAQSLNRSLVDLMVFPALANLAEGDPRRRSIVPAYSGKRLPTTISFSGKVVTLDPTALLTLSFLGLLDSALDVFETVYLPHSTLWWLFEERERASFHQPTRIAEAHRLRDLLATGALEPFAPSTVASSHLAVQIGDELASLIAEAGQVRHGDDSQHIVVRSAPVHRLSSLMQEEADLSSHASTLSSCLAVIEKLRQKGQLTVEEEKLARSYMRLHERPWPNQPEIRDGATLYMDGLTVSHFMRLGLLKKLRPAGLRAVCSSRAVSEADALLSYEQLSVEVQDVIERIRVSLSRRIETGEIRCGPRRSLGERTEDLGQEHPTIELLALATQCDIAIVDDRYLNQHLQITHESHQAEALSTLDLLDALVRMGVLTDEDWREYRTQLRRAAYSLIPVSEEEVARYLAQSATSDGRVIESAELRAIRESLLRVRMSDWLQLPSEAPWLDGTLKALASALRTLWTDDADLEDAAARSNWCLMRSDIRGWAHVMKPETAEHVIDVERAAFLSLVLSPPAGSQAPTVEAYWAWIDEAILMPLQEQFPGVYEQIVFISREFVADVAEGWRDEGGAQ